MSSSDALDIFRWSVARSARSGRRESSDDGCTVYPRRAFFLGDAGDRAGRWRIPGAAH
jgi:hypothetical protein